MKSITFIGGGPGGYEALSARPNSGSGSPHRRGTTRWSMFEQRLHTDKTYWKSAFFAEEMRKMSGYGFPKLTSNANGR